MPVCTWDPANKAAAITLSPDKLTATLAGSPGNRGCVLATVGHSSGVYWWENTFVSNSGLQDPMFGIAIAGVSQTGYLGQDANGWSYETTVKYHNGSGNVLNPGFVVTQTVGYVFDIGALTLELFIDGVDIGMMFDSGVPGLLAPGTYYPACGPGYATANSAVALANFGASVSPHLAAYLAFNPAAQPWGGPGAAGNFLSLL
jgi:hypothetical protein